MNIDDFDKKVIKSIELHCGRFCYAPRYEYNKQYWAKAQAYYDELKQFHDEDLEKAVEEVIKSGRGTYLIH